MKTRYCFVVALTTLAAVPLRGAMAAPLGTAFTYQGQLKNAGDPADGTFNMTFRLFDAANGGAQVGPELNMPADVAAGLFSVLLDFGAAPFAGERRWLEVAVNNTPLTPRQELTPAPYGIFAESSAVADSLSLPFEGDASSGNAAMSLTFSGNGSAVSGTSSGGDGLVGNSSTLVGCGVHGISDSGTGVCGDSTSGTGVRGTSTSGTGVRGNSPNGTGVRATTGSCSGLAVDAQNSCNGAFARLGTTSYGSNTGIYAGSSSAVSPFLLCGDVIAGGTGNAAVWGDADGIDIGVAGTATGSAGSPFGGYGVMGLCQNFIGVYGASHYSGCNPACAAGVYGQTGYSGICNPLPGVFGDGGTHAGVFGASDTSDGVNGWSNDGVGVFGYSNNNWAGFFNGALFADSASAGIKAFKIDHPLDPANKYLQHSSVESPEMLNVYSGNAVLDAGGSVWVELPGYFEALNRDYRYQLTCIGGVAAVYVAQEVTDGRFQIAGGNSGLKVSWMVTGIRQDATANAHRVVAEIDKPAGERGKYLDPEAFGLPRELGIGYRPELTQVSSAATGAAAVKENYPSHTPDEN